MYWLVGFSCPVSMVVNVHMRRGKHEVSYQSWVLFGEVSFNASSPGLPSTVVHRRARCRALAGSFCSQALAAASAFILCRPDATHQGAFHVEGEHSGSSATGRTLLHSWV